MRDIVLIHGAWHGGWVWDKLVPLLDQHGARTWAPSLIGLAERFETGGHPPSLTEQVDDIAQRLAADDMRDIVLCGHSFGGIVITALADRLPERIGALVYLDALLPRDGQSAADLLGASPGDDDFIPPPPAAAFRLADPADIWLTDRLMTPHPRASTMEKVRLRGAHAATPSRTYVLSRGFPTIHPGAAFDRFAAYDRLSKNPEWKTVALDCGHNAMRDDPATVARILLEAATQGS